MRKALLLVLLSGIITFLPQVRGEERGVVVEGPAARLPDSKGNWAVVVGVNQFEDQGIHPLSYAVADAQAIAEELTQIDGLIPRDQIYLHISGGELEPTRGNILKSIKFTVEHVPADGLVLIYLSSHGFLDGQKRSYVMPKDGHTDLLEDTALSVARIQELLTPTYCKAAKRILIVDACRDEPLRSGRGGGEEVSTSFTEQLRQVRGMVTMVSCGPGEVSYEDEQLGHGVFSYFFMEGLRGAAGRDHQGFITISTLSDYVSQAVEGWCKQKRKSPFQTPWILSEMTRSIPMACPGNSSPLPPSPTPVPTVTSVSLQDTITNSIAMKLKLIPAGEFMMGSENGEDNERPVHQVRIEKPFYLGITEVTQGQWRMVMGNNPSHFTGDDNLPTEQVSWEDCQEFVRKLSEKEGVTYRLPSEAEWEYACRAGSTGKWCFGDDESRLGEYAWCIENSENKTHPVGKKAPNAWGLYDMYGNVWEWCEDGWRDGYEGAPTDGSVWAAGSDESRVIRGAGWFYIPSYCRSAIRQGYSQTFRYFDLGFRVARTP